jgi:hypothetical protein
VGINGTTRVLIEYTKAVRNKGLLLDPVNIKKDAYDFVYAPDGIATTFTIPSGTHRRTTSSFLKTSALRSSVFSVLQ